MRLKPSKKKVDSGDYSLFSSEELGLPLGISALVIRKRDLPGGAPPRTGGGVVKLVAKKSVVWSTVPERYEAGTPAVINTIAFAKALQLTGKYGKSAFRTRGHTDLSAKELFEKDGFDGLRGKELLARLRDHVVGKDIRVPTDKGSLIYANLDNAASTPALRPVWDVFRAVLSLPSEHRGALISAARKICHGFLRAPEADYDIFFTANTTDSLNVLAANLYLKENPETETVVLNTMLEHHSNELVWRFNGRVALRRLPVDSDAEERGTVLYSMTAAPFFELISCLTCCQAAYDCRTPKTEKILQRHALPDRLQKKDALHNHGSSRDERHLQCNLDNGLPARIYPWGILTP